MASTARPGLAALALLFTAANAPAQQVPDRGFRPPITKAEFAAGKGPTVCVDEAHFNFHTLGDRFWAFGELLRRDGYQVVASTKKFDTAALAGCTVLVISNAQPNGDEWDQYPYPTPAAFTDAEITSVARWVNDGGALLLIADHMPFAGAAARLAAAFEVEFLDGFVLRDPDRKGQDIFSTADGTLRDHVIVRGRNPRESVARVRTFTGQGFRAPGAEPLLVIPAGYALRMPKKAWQIEADTPSLPARDLLQAALKSPGKGRVAFFGEAAMFTAQLAGADRQPMGMNSPGAEANFQLVLNVVHWLSRKL
jgi:hypothetical protein